MKFKFAVTLSIILHISLFALMIFMPRTDVRKETTYYVDLIQFSTGTGGPGGSGGKQEGKTQLVEPEPQAGQPSQSDATVIETEEPAGKIKDLTVKKETLSKIRYPDQEGRKKKEKEPVVSVTRKKRTSPDDGRKAVSRTRPGGSGGLSTGISTGTGSGNGSGSGFGDGTGGFGGYFPYAYYIDALKGKISSSWYNSLVTPGLRGKFVAIAYFEIQRNGKVSGLKLEKESGIETIDLSALRAVENASPFPPLPSDFPSSYLAVHFKFEWEK